MLRLNQKELTNEHIQEIGIKYIKAFGEKPSVFHSNQPVAKMLSNYNKESTVEDKWYFLADAYSQLDLPLFIPSNSKLETDIIDKFQQAFNQPVQIRESGGSDRLSKHLVASRLKDIAKQYFMGEEILELRTAITKLK